MKLSIYNNVGNSYNYEMKLIRYHIFMKEFIFLLKNEILPLQLLEVNKYFYYKWYAKNKSHKLTAGFSL